MRIRHHLDDATLMSFAAGSLPEALSAVVAAHVAMCPRCAAEAKRMEQVGACLIDELRPEPVARPTPVEAWRRASVPEKKDSPRSACAAARDGVRAVIGSDLDALPWKRLALGVWHLPLALSPGAGGGLRLLKVAPGHAIPEHGHGAAELTLVLRGAYTDETGRYGAGDVADVDEEIEHCPVADRETGCICLLASEKPARFKGVLPRLVQTFTGI